MFQCSYNYASIVYNLCVNFLCFFLLRFFSVDIETLNFTIMHHLPQQVAFHAADDVRSVFQDFSLNVGVVTQTGNS